METIISNPGLYHLAEKVFWNLDVEDLKICAHINQSCKQILQNPIFCLGKFKHLSKENKEDWIKVIQSVNNSDRGIAIISYLQWNLKRKAMVDLPCYTNPAIQDDFGKKIRRICLKTISISDEDIEMVKILAPLTENPNMMKSSGTLTPIHLAACNGHIEIVKILAPLIYTTNSSNAFTTIHLAERSGHSEIVKFLTQFVKQS